MKDFKLLLPYRHFSLLTELCWKVVFLSWMSKSAKSKRKENTIKDVKTMTYRTMTSLFNHSYYSMLANQSIHQVSLVRLNHSLKWLRTSRETYIDLLWVKADSGRRLGWTGESWIIFGSSSNISREINIQQVHTLIQQCTIVCNHTPCTVKDKMFLTKRMFLRLEKLCLLL